MTDLMSASRFNVRFLMRLAAALHRYGTPTNRLEEALYGMARVLGVEAQFLATPTSITASVGPEGEQEIRLLRLDPGEQNLEKLARLHDVMKLVGASEMNAARGAEKIRTIVDAPMRYGKSLTVLGFMAASSTATYLFGGAWNEIIVGLAIGTVLGLLAVFSLPRPRLARMYFAIAAMIAALAAGLAAFILQPLYPFIAILGSLIVLIPGLSLTIAMNELANGHLMSGTARFAWALFIFLQMGFGVAVGVILVGTLGTVPVPVEPAQLPDYLKFVAFPIAAAGFTVLFRARPSDYIWILLVSAVSYAAARVGAAVAGSVIAAAFGAWVLGCSSNLLARLRDEPAAITFLPGLILLVPGSVGFRSIEALVQHDVVSGIEAAFFMTLTAMALVTGMLLANLTVASRRLL
ncbi:MAG: threonine/serine exporter family protein [Gammaproteobacteria bacterium]